MNVKRGLLRRVWKKRQNKKKVGMPCFFFFFGFEKGVKVEKRRANKQETEGKARGWRLKQS